MLTKNKIIKTIRNNKEFQYYFENRMSDYSHKFKEFDDFCVLISKNKKSKTIYVFILTKTLLINDCLTLNFKNTIKIKEFEIITNYINERKKEVFVFIKTIDKDAKETKKEYHLYQCSRLYTSYKNTFSNKLPVVFCSFESNEAGSVF